MNNYYRVEDIYLISSCTELKGIKIDHVPFNIFKDPIRITVAYIRWSTAGQTDKHTLSIQQNAIILKARSLGYKVIVFFVEKQTSAYHVEASKRKEMKALKKFVISNSNIESIIFWKDSRVSRLIFDFPLDILAPIKNEHPNIKVYSTDMDGEWDEKNPLVQLQLTMSNQESEKKSNESRQYQESKLENHERPEGRPPYGYDFKDGRMVRNKYSSVVRFIFYLYSFGYREKKICDILNKTEIPTPDEYLDQKNNKDDVKSYKWNEKSIAYILQNAWYVGDFLFFSRMSRDNSKKKPREEIELFKVEYEAIIPLYLWEIVTYLRKIKGDKRNKRKLSTDFILEGLLKCKSCDSPLKTRNSTPSNSKRDYKYYFCPNCKKKLDIKVIHAEVLTDFKKKWSRSIQQHSKESLKFSKSWIKKLKIKKEEIKQQIQIIKYNENMLHQIESEFEKKLKQTYKLQVRNKNNQISEIQLLIDRIEKTLTQNTDELIERFVQNFESYSNEELTSTLLLSIQEILADFEQETPELYIDYRLTPYVELENQSNYYNSI
ncbi:recombinase family protein [Rossellomorea aquimaris]|uniref:recombinase family protein n=1 Tax=Rossellomorea aquimaris TaxID=189382 RepID=UPI0007D0ADBF|nr:recombinase family protein [Rossellomorea aquimaris]